MEYKEVYEEYKTEHPDELTELNALYSVSERIEVARGKRRAAKRALIAECRRALDGK